MCISVQIFDSPTRNNVIISAASLHDKCNSIRHGPFVACVCFVECHMLPMDGRTKLSPAFLSKWGAKIHKKCYGKIKTVLTLSSLSLFFIFLLLLLFPFDILLTSMLENKAKIRNESKETITLFPF